MIEALYLVLGQDFKAGGHQHGADGRGFHGNRAYKHRGYVVQDEDAAEYDYAESEWPSEYDDGAYYGWDDNEPDADEEHWNGEETFDSQAAYCQTDAEDAHEYDLPWHDVEAYDSAYAAYLELKLSPGYFPIVALSDPSAGNLSPGVSQLPSSSPSSKGKKGKAGESSSKGGSRSSPKGGSPKGKADAFLQVHQGSDEAT